MRLILALLLMQGVATAAIRDIVTRLRHVQTHEGDAIIPPSAISDLTALKHALRDLITNTVNVATDMPPEELQARVIAQLEREDVPVGDITGDDGGYGVITAINLARPKEYPGWLIATTSLAIPYGDDTSLYVYEIRTGAWQLAMSLESNGYDEISGAQGWLQYRVGLSLGGRVPFLVATDHNPWPTSNWQGLRLGVFQVSRRPEHPLRLVKRDLFYWISEPYQVSIRPGGFGLIYDGPSVPGVKDWNVAVHYREYAVSPGAAVLLRASAVDPNVFAGRWAQAPWSIASASVDEPARAGSREWHDRLRQSRFPCLGGTELARRVSEGRERLLAITECSDSTPVGYLVLRAGSQGFRIASISSNWPKWLPDEAPPSCTPAPPGETHPTVEQTVQPKLPDGFESGAVRLKVVAEAGGAVRSVHVIDWPDRPGLVVPAIRAVRQWKFKPGTRDSCTVADEQTVDVVFTK